MIRCILFLVILKLCISCNSTKQEGNLGQKANRIKNTEIKVNKNIYFDFSAEQINNIGRTIEIKIKANLINKNTDTVYFLSSSCEGDQYSLRYDKSKFTLSPYINCNLSFPRLIKIAPKGHYGFQAHFRCSSKHTKIKLGFDFYSVDKSIDLNKIILSDIHGRNKKEQTVIWTEEKTIK